LFLILAQRKNCSWNVWNCYIGLCPPFEYIKINAVSETGSYSVFRWTGCKVKPLFSHSVEPGQAMDSIIFRRHKKSFLGVIKHCALKIHWMSGGVASCLFNFITGWKWMVNGMSWPFYPWIRSPSNHWVACWVPFSGGLNAVEKTKVFCPSWQFNPNSLVV
jgi:hypothetical protein